MSGRAYDPRFLFSWAGSKTAVMGAEQLSGVMEIVMRESAETQGKPVDEDGIAGMKAFIEAEAEKQSLDYFISGMVYDDGVIDPRDTRSILGICLSAIHTNPVKGAEGFGVFRL
jgi:acetyl-CoA carboxylase carboxyltransferase component